MAIKRHTSNKWSFLISPSLMNYALHSGDRSHTVRIKIHSMISYNAARTKMLLRLQGVRQMHMCDRVSDYRLYNMRV